MQQQQHFTGLKVKVVGEDCTFLGDQCGPLDCHLLSICTERVRRGLGTAPGSYQVWRSMCDAREAFVNTVRVFTCLTVPEVRAPLCQPVDTTSSLSLPHVSQSLNRQSCSKSNLQPLNPSSSTPGTGVKRRSCNHQPICIPSLRSMKHRAGQDKHVRCAGHRRRLQVFP